MKIPLKIIAALAFLIASIARAQDLQTKSPDGNVEVHFSLKVQTGEAQYSIRYRANPIVEESRLGLEPYFVDSFQVTGSSTRTHDGQWENRFGELRIVPDKFSELTVDLIHTSGNRLQIIFRAYNEGAALRYAFPKQETTEFRFTGERTEFAFPPDTFGYEEHATE